MPMYSDSWDKNPYHPNYGHVLDVTPLSDPRNGNRHEDGYYSVRFLADSLTRDYGSLPHTNNYAITGDIAMFGASALGNTQLQAAAAHRVDPSPQARGLKALFPIVASTEHYKSTGFQNGVFRDRLVTGWLKGQIFTGTDDDLNDIDLSIDNNLHSATDYGLPNKFDAANKAIDHFVSVRYNGGPAGYYPNSIGRADMDASRAMVDANGEGSANGTFSRYTNMRVPSYHLTGWWDIFTPGQIETWQLTRKHNNAPISDLQKIVIGPWAHQTTGGRTTGDLTYPENVADIIGLALDNFEDSIDIGKLTNSEIIGWFRYNLNYIPGKELGEPKVIIPASDRWQQVSSLFEVRVPAQDLIVPLEDLFNFVIGQGDLEGVSVEVRAVGALAILLPDPLPFTVPVPNLGPLIEEFELGAASAIGYKDFRQVPNVRFYVPGPVEDGEPANAGVGNYWFAADTFPIINNIRWTNKYLHANGSITDAPPTQDEGYKMWVHDPDDPILTIGGSNMIVRTPQGDRDSQGQFNLKDPRYAPFSLDRPGVISFSTPELTDTLSIMGFPKMKLWAKSNPAGTVDGPTDTDFMVRVLDVYPDGREFFVFEGVVNARARDYARYLAENPGKEDANIPFTNIESGRLYEYYFEMLPIAYTWGINHKMKILVASSSYTRYQVNPNLPIEDGEFFRRKPGDGQTYNYNGVDMAPRVAVQRIHFSPEHPTHIELPVHDLSYVVGSAESQPIDPSLEILVYPNPAQHEANIYVGRPGNYQVQVFDMNGRLVLDSGFRDELAMATSTWQSGVYLVRVSDLKNGKMKTQKLVVE